MSDNANAQPQGVGLDDAVLHMPEIPMDDYAPNPNPREPEAAPLRERDEAGKFKAKEPEAKAPAKSVDAKAEAPADDEDYIEEPAEEEGKEPVRYKLSEVLNGYKESAKLKEELTKVKNAPVMPAELETALSETIKARQQYLDGLKRTYEQTNVPAPDLDMVNPNSPKYNPEQFHATVTAYQQAQQQRAAIEEHYKELNTRQTQEQEAIRAAKWQREVAKLQTIWPEVLTDTAAQAKAKEGLAKHYGIDDAFLKSDLTLDHRIYALAKDALAYRESQAKSAEAVKVVRAKPRVVHGQARQNTNSQQRASADGLKRLAASGSLEDAVDALSGLL